MVRLAELVLALVIALFAAGVLRQFGRLSQRGLLLDTLGILPQWKFFGQTKLAGAEGEFDDFHLLARHGAGGWQEVLCFEERTLASALWNPGDLAKLTLAEPVVELGRHGKQAMTSLPYLIVLRHCLDRLGAGEALQFAVATTRGRGEQEPRLAFLSAWHVA